MSMTFGEIGGGTFFDVKEEAFEVMDRAIKELLRAKKTRQVLRQIEPDRLATLVREVQEEIGDSRKEEDPWTDYDAFLRYLRDLLDSMPHALETGFDIDDLPGRSSAYHCYWVKHAGWVAKGVLRRIKEEAKSLRKLV
jgi:hypothetical protein